MRDISVLKNIVEDMVTSYEKRVEGIDSIFDTVYLILSEFQDSVFHNREERGKISSQIRDILAKNEHLRKKDFDTMMQGILQFQEAEELEIRSLLKDYFGSQKNVALSLKENLREFKDFLAKGEAERVKEFHALIGDILKKQEERKEEVTSKLKEFQKEQKEMSEKLKELLAKGQELRIKDLKLMLREFKTKQEKRLADQKRRREETKKRKEDVAKMLEGFKKERAKSQLFTKAV